MKLFIRRRCRQTRNANSQNWGETKSPTVGVRLVLVTAILALGVGVSGNAQAQSPNANETTTVQAAAPSLGTADAYAVLSASTITNTGPTVLNGDLGLSPGTEVTGFPPGTVNGTQHVTDANASQAQLDLTTAYNTLAGSACDASLFGQNLGGLTLTAGTYCYPSSAQLTGTLTLDAQGNPDAVFIIQVGSSLTTASDSTVTLTNSAQACNVFWQVGSSATLGTATRFEGRVLSLTSITANTGATVGGALLARNGAVTLDNNTITRSQCAAASPPDNPTSPPDNPNAPDNPTSPPDNPNTPDNPTGPPETPNTPDNPNAPPVGDGNPGSPGPTIRTPKLPPPNAQNPQNPPCTAQNFTFRVRTRDASGVKSVKVFLDEKLIKRSSSEDFKVLVKSKQLGEGSHTILVVATNGKGVQSEKSRQFDRCEVPMIRTINTNLKKCVANNFRIAIHSPQGSVNVRVFLDGKMIKSSVKKNFRVLIESKDLASMRHQVKAVSEDDAGTKTVRSRSFTRCDRPALPRFTG